MATPVPGKDTSNSTEKPIHMYQVFRVIPSTAAICSIPLKITQYLYDEITAKDKQLIHDLGVIRAVTY
jgi:hypothetical protein